MVGSVGTAVGRPPRIGTAARTGTTDSSRPRRATSLRPSSAGMGCWPSSAEVVQTAGLPIASASSCHVRPLARRAAMICWVISSRVMQPSSVRGPPYARRMTAVLITGANSGIGKEVARQFAVLDAFDTIYLGCRSGSKATAAREDLERITGKSVFATVPMDTTDLGSVKAALDVIDGPLSAVVMNAGGQGGATPMALTADGVTEIFASNVL